VLPIVFSAPRACVVRSDEITRAMWYPSSAPQHTPYDCVSVFQETDGEATGMQRPLRIASDAERKIRRGYLGSV
jgi:hypothetical protein